MDTNGVFRIAMRLPQRAAAESKISKKNGLIQSPILGHLHSLLGSHRVCRLGISPVPLEVPNSWLSAVGSPPLIAEFRHWCHSKNAAEKWDVDVGPMMRSWSNEMGEIEWNVSNTHNLSSERILHNAQGFLMLSIQGLASLAHQNWSKHLVKAPIVTVGNCQKVPWNLAGRELKPRWPFSCLTRPTSSDITFRHQWGTTTFKVSKVSIFLMSSSVTSKVGICTPE